MMLRAIGRTAALLTLLGLSGQAPAAENPDEGDLRDLKVGMSVENLPAHGYIGFACGSDGGKAGTPLEGWQDYARCPAGPSGWHEVTFEYDEEANPWAEVSDRFEGTTVAGHPIVPSLLIDDQGIVQGIRIVTDPAARMYLKKKAFLLYIRVMGRYGRDGWECVENEPSDGRTPVGGMYIDRRCEKTFHGRRLIMDTDLYRTADQSGQEFTGATRLEILNGAAG
jgi:hypothetical protein